MQQHPNLDIRFYNSDGTARRLMSKDTTIVSARWKSSRYTGYKDATFTFAGDIAELTESDFSTGRQPVRENDRVRVYVGGELRWSGYVGAVARTEGQPATVTVNCQGVYLRIARVPVDGRFVSPVSVDVVQAFASFAYQEAVAAYPGLVVSIEAESGLMTTSEDAFNKSIGAVFDTLSERFGGRVVFGCDELYAGDIDQPMVDRLYLRDVGSLTDPDFSFAVPGAFRGCGLELAEGGRDITQLCNILSITGVDPLYPNYLGEACNGNPAFERPIFTDFAAHPLLIDFSFEASILSSWSLGGGATQKVAAIEGIPARSGERYLELDAIGESASQTITTPLIAGQTVLAGINARRENAGFSGSYKIGIQFRNGGADVGALQLSEAFSPDDARYRESSFQASVPAGTVTGFVVSFEMTAGGGNGKGLCLDDGFAYISALKQDGWRLVDAGGTGTINSVDYVHSADKTQGRYSLKLDVSSTNSDGNDIYLETTGKFPVNPGAILEFGGDFRTWDGTTNGLFRLDLRFYDSDGAETGSAELTPVLAGAVGGTWIQKRSNAKTVPAGAVACLARITFRGNSKLLIDRLYVRDTAAPTINGEREWIGSGAYRTTFTTDDDPFISKPYHDSIALYGKKFEQIQVDNVVDYYSALATATAYFDTFGMPLANPQIRFAGSPETFLCGQTVRVAGASGQWLGGDPEPGELSKAFPVAEIEESADSAGKVSTTLSLEIEQPSLTSLISRIFDKKRRATTGGGVASLAGSPVGGSSGTSQSLSLPVSLANGGLGASNATVADARTTLGLGGGETATITLYGPTTPGSITVVNGIITAHVNPV
jgi:hypothetical protein